MAKNEDYSIEENDLLTINKGLSKAKEGGGIRFDDLLQNQEECPFCHSKAYMKEIVTTDKKGKDKKATIKIIPFVVDRDSLTWRTHCCSMAGAAANYIMVTRRKTVKEAVRYLKQFVRR